MPPAHAASAGTPRPTLDSVHDFSPTQSELAYGRIWAAILSSELAPGSRLVEERLADTFGMSRTPVREAIRRLQAEGLVSGEPNKGATVRLITSADVRDLYDLRSRMESYATALAAERRSDADLADLTAAAAAFRTAVESLVGRPRRTAARLDEVYAANNVFHATVLETSRHARLQQLLARAVDRPLVHQAFGHYTDDELRGSARFHELIVDAIARCEPDRAERLAREHVLQARDVLLAALPAVADGDRA